MDVITRLEYRTRNGRIVPLATSRNPRLARMVAHHILGELDELSETHFDDELLNILAVQEREHVGEIFSAMGLRETLNGH
jgi:hypothetical protein